MTMFHVRKTPQFKRSPPTTASCMWVLLLLLLAAAMTTTTTAGSSFLSCEAFVSSSETLCFQHHARFRQSIQRRDRPFISPVVRSHGSSNLPTRLYVAPEVLLGCGVVVGGVAGWLYVDGADDRQRQQQRQKEEEQYRQYQEERAQRAYIEPKDFWTEEELAPYDGSKDPDGPILMAADGLVFNVYKGRNFYGLGGEYHLFAGRDATRFLAKTIVEEEKPEEAAKPLNMAERASLAAWLFTIKGKYQVVGKLEGFDPSTTSMRNLGS